jgi:LysR family transcriptional regulator, glycine cleavage system transcriptional activator
LFPRLETFRRDRPGCELRIGTSTNLIDFAAKRVDVGVRYGGGAWPGLTVTFLTRDAFFPVCSPLLREGQHPLRSLEDLRHHQLIHDVNGIGAALSDLARLV